MSTRAVHPPRSEERKLIWSSCISTARYTNRDQRGKSISSAAVYQQQSARQTPQATAISKAEAYLAQLYTTKVIRKTKAKALQDDTAVSTRAVYKPRLAKQKSIWHNCISTVRYINRDRPGESISSATVYQQPSETKAKAHLDDTAASTKALHQPRSARHGTVV